MEINMKLLEQTMNNINNYLDECIDIIVASFDDTDS